LAGAVLAQERENFTGAKRHADVRERLRAAEALEHAADPQQLARVRSLRSLVRRALRARARLHRSSRGRGRIRLALAYPRLRQHARGGSDLRKKPPAAREPLDVRFPCLRINALSYGQFREAVNP